MFFTFGYINLLFIGSTEMKNKSGFAKIARKTERYCLPVRKTESARKAEREREKERRREKKSVCVCEKDR